MKLYFVRHGESQANILGQISNRGTPHGLTEKGRAQAVQLAQRLAAADIFYLLSSPLLRARQTAEILAAHLSVPYHLTDALREYDCGIIEGRADSAAWDIYRAVMEAWRQPENWGQRIEQGESLLDIKARFEPLLARLIQEYADHAGGIVLVGHGGVYRHMLPLVLPNLPPHFTFEHAMDNTSYAVAELRPAGLVCLECFGISLNQEVI